MAAGFVHGVLNSDNINVTGESFDYGPWRFTPEWDADFVAAYFDEAGLYAFGRQPEAIHWDLAQLAGCLTLIVEDTAPLSDLLAGWIERFDAGAGRGAGLPGWASRRASRRTIAHSPRQSSRRCDSTAVTIDRFFFDWRGGRDPGGETILSAPFQQLRAASLRTASGSHQSSILVRRRRHVHSISAKSNRFGRRSPSDDDWGPFNAKIAAIRRMGEAMREGPAR